MIGQQFRLVRRHFGEAFFERAGNALMPFPPARQKQTLISGVAHQRVLETEAALQTAPLRKDNFRRDEFRQRGFEVGAASRGNRIKKCECKLPANDGGDLRNFAGLAKTIETCHQRIFERGRNGGAVVARRFHHAFGQFLREQRNAVGLGNNRRDRFGG